MREEYLNQFICVFDWKATDWWEPYERTLSTYKWINENGIFQLGKNLLNKFLSSGWIATKDEKYRIWTALKRIPSNDNLRGWLTEAVKYCWCQNDTYGLNSRFNFTHRNYANFYLTNALIDNQKERTSEHAHKKHWQMCIFFCFHCHYYQIVKVQLEPTIVNMVHWADRCFALKSQCRTLWTRDKKKICCESWVANGKR